MVLMIVIKFLNRKLDLQNMIWRLLVVIQFSCASMIMVADDDNNGNRRME